MRTRVCSTPGFVPRHGAHSPENSAIWFHMIFTDVIGFIFLVNTYVLSNCYVHSTVLASLEIIVRNLPSLWEVLVNPRQTMWCDKWMGSMWMLWEFWAGRTPPGARLLQPHHRCTVVFLARQEPLSGFGCLLLSPLTVHLSSHEKGLSPHCTVLLPSTAPPPPLWKLGRQILGCWWGLSPLQAHGQDLGSPVNDIKMVDPSAGSNDYGEKTQPCLDWAALGMRQWPRSQGSGRAFQKPLCSWDNP